MSESDIHRKLAVECFNATWDLLDKADRTEEESAAMIHTAHCSRYHWGFAGTPLEHQRGEWQISRVYSVLGMGESALYHALLCRETCRREDIGDFDLAFSLEALARAYMVLGKTDECRRYLESAGEAAEGIAEKDNRDYFLSELSSISC